MMVELHIFLCIYLMRDVLFYYPPFCVFYDQNKPLKRECEKDLIYTRTPVNIKPQSLTFAFAVISASIFMQQKGTEEL